MLSHGLKQPLLEYRSTKSKLVDNLHIGKSMKTEFIVLSSSPACFDVVHSRLASTGDSHGLGKPLSGHRSTRGMSRELHKDPSSRGT